VVLPSLCDAVSFFSTVTQCYVVPQQSGVPRSRTHPTRVIAGLPAARRRPTSFVVKPSRKRVLIWSPLSQVLLGLCGMGAQTQLSCRGVLDFKRLPISSLILSRTAIRRQRPSHGSCRIPDLFFDRTAALQTTWSWPIRDPLFRRVRFSEASLLPDQPSSSFPFSPSELDAWPSGSPRCLLRDALLFLSSFSPRRPSHKTNQKLYLSSPRPSCGPAPFLKLPHHRAWAESRLELALCLTLADRLFDPPPCLPPFCPPPPPHTPIFFFPSP